MTLHIVIVNYNVKYFLEQCLESIYRSECRCPLELYVVDNASVDGSVEMVREKFPQVHLTANSENCGFAKANNQVLRSLRTDRGDRGDRGDRDDRIDRYDREGGGEILSGDSREGGGDYVLLLNPDTVVERDTFEKCLDFFLTHPDCGGIGVKMINGEGVYLKESKRGFPTPEASFFKISGLIRLFPHNRRIAAYYMGHLPDDETNKVDILPGAFMMVRMEALEKVGLLDESYFMYGEDIDFSWRIKLAGYENYYLPSARIIHYKGESTKRGSMNYVYTFYNAMSIFVQHYFTGRNARLFNLLLRMAIWGRASVSFLKRAVTAVSLPIADFLVAYAGFVGIKHFWAAYWAENINYYPAEYTWLVIPLYILTLMAVGWFYGGYDKPIKLFRMVKGMAVGSALLLVFYSLLDESLRYSRALLLLGCGWTLASTLGIRALLSLLQVPGFNLRTRRKRCSLVVGSPEECARVEKLYAPLGGKIASLGLEYSNSQQLNEAIIVYKADEVIFCSKDIDIRQIIDIMTHLSELPGNRRMVDVKIAPQETDFIIGSNSIHRTEDLYTEELNTVASPMNRRNKRLLDIGVSLLLLTLSPVLIWWQKHPSHYLGHCLQVLVGKRTWVAATGGIFTPEQALRRSDELSDELRERIRLRYERNYRPLTDLQIIIRNIRKI